METNQEQQPAPQNKFVSYVKFLFSLLLLRLAYKAFIIIPIKGAASQTASILWGILFLIWGISWFFKLPSLSRMPSIQKITGNLNFKKTIKWMVVILVLVSITFSVISAFDGFIPGLSGKDFFTIMLAPVLH